MTRQFFQIGKTDITPFPTQSPEISTSQHFAAQPRFRIKQRYDHREMIVHRRNNSYNSSFGTGHIASVSGYVTSYLNLHEINKELLERNGQLEMELLELQDRLDMMVADTVAFAGFAPDSTEQFAYSFILAGVVNNSVSHLSNYITVNKGSKDGIAPDMGVVSERGVVGIVSTVNDHFSVIIPLLNPIIILDDTDIVQCLKVRSQFHLQ